MVGLTRRFLALALVMFALSSASHAQLPSMSGPRGGGSGGGDPSPGSYTIDDALAGARCTPTPPTLPNITNGEQLVTPANYMTYMDDNGKRLIFTAGDYGTLEGDGFRWTYVSADDQELVLQDGANLHVLTFRNTANRIRVVSEHPRRGLVEFLHFEGRAGGSSDITIDGISGDGGATNTNELNGVRVAILNSRLRTGAYGIGAFPNDGFDGPSDYILGNNEFISYNTQSMSRFMNVDQLLVTDNHFVKESGGLVLRLHSDATTNPIACAEYTRNQVDAVVAENFGHVFAGLSNPANKAATISTVYFEYNELYCDCDLQAGAGTPPDIIEQFFVRFNNFYGGKAPSELLPAWDVSSNNILPFDSTPPAWTFHEDR